MIDLKKDDKNEQRDQEIEHLRSALKQAHEKIQVLVAEIELVKLRLDEARAGSSRTTLDL